MKIDFEGRVWQLEMDEVGVRQAEKIAAYTGGLTPMGWYNSIPQIEAPGWLKSVECLYWLMHEQNADPITLGSADFLPLKLFMAFAEAQKTGDGAAEAEPGPTRAAEEPQTPELPGSPTG